MIIDFTTEQLGVLDKALQQMPYGMVAPLVNSINAQLAPQVAAQQKASEAAIFPKSHQQNGE